MDKCVKNNIENCLEVIESNGYTKCVWCIDGYGLRGLECTIGWIQNCQIYVSYDKCKECNKPYYLMNNQCILPKLIKNCQKYNLECTECEENYYKHIDYTCE